MMIVIQPLAQAQLDAADQILLGAFGGNSRKERLRTYLSLQPDGWILAHLEGIPVGIAGIVNYGPIAYIGLVGVDPAYQRRGIALAMMQHLIDWAERHGNPTLLLDASESGAPLYERLGFIDDEQTISFMRDSDLERPPSPGHVSLLQPHDLPAVAAFDAPIFGANRLAVLKMLLHEAPDRAFVARDPNGQISGYLFAQAMSLNAWAARTPADAEALLASALALPYQAGPYVAVPGSNSDAAALLARYGFRSNRSLRHMRLGGAGPVGQRTLLYGLASFAIG